RDPSAKCETNAKHAFPLHELGRGLVVGHEAEQKLSRKRDGTGNLPRPRGTSGGVNAEALQAMSRHVATFSALIIATMLVTGASGASSGAPGLQPPVNQAPPSITGNAVVGTSLA